MLTKNNTAMPVSSDDEYTLPCHGEVINAYLASDITQTPSYHEDQQVGRYDKQERHPGTMKRRRERSTNVEDVKQDGEGHNLGVKRSRQGDYHITSTPGMKRMENNGEPHVSLTQTFEKAVAWPPSSTGAASTPRTGWPAHLELRSKGSTASTVSTGAASPAAIPGSAAADNIAPSTGHHARVNPPYRSIRNYKGDRSIIERDAEGQLTDRGREEANTQLLKTLGMEGNVITNSDLYSRQVSFTDGFEIVALRNIDAYRRTMHIVPASTGHQQSQRGGAKFSVSGKDYFRSRNQKLKQQFTASPAPTAEIVGADSVTGARDEQERFVLQSRIFSKLRTSNFNDCQDCLQR